MSETPRPTLDSRLLRHFLAVIDHGNMTAAAATLGLTQPALSKSIQHLEQELGLDLFLRHPGGVTPTHAGEVLIRHARLIEAGLRGAAEEIDAIRHGTAATIQVGASPLWSGWLLPDAVAALERDLPRARVRILGGVVDTLIPALQRGELDLVCSALDFPDHPDVVKEPLAEVEHRVVAHRDHHLAGQIGISPEALLTSPWARIANDSIALARLGAYFSANGLAQPRIAAEVQPVEALIGLLRPGHFLASVAAPMLTLLAPHGIVELKIHGTLWRFRAGMAYRAAAASNPTLNLLMTHLRSLSTAPAHTFR
jgi:DNA-binding transcriptional LysR family regulator